MSFSVKVNLKRLNDNAVLPTMSKEGDLCYDVWAVSEEEIAPNIWRYGLGFAYEIKRPIEAIAVFDSGRELVTSFDSLKVGIELKPRSSIHKTGMVLANSEGTLDEFYRGEAMAVFYHLFPNMPRYKVGDRIGQIKVTLTPVVEFNFVDEINMDTERGENGFGSTGK